MNSFDRAKEAIEQTRAHHCNDACSRNAKGICLHKLFLWRNQRSVVLKWNQPAAGDRNAPDPPDTVTVNKGYL